MRVLVWLLLAAVLILTGAFPVIAAVLAGAVALAVSGAVALLVQPPILITGLLALVAVAVRRRPV
jgi:hypothetical protein